MSVVSICQLESPGPQIIKMLLERPIKLPVSHCQVRNGGAASDESYCSPGFALPRSFSFLKQDGETNNMPHSTY